MSRLASDSPPHADLATRLSAGDVAPDDGLRHDGLIALMEAVGDEATVASQLEGLLPPESGIWVFSGDVAETLRGLPSRLEAHPALDVLILTGDCLLYTSPSPRDS